MHLSKLPPSTLTAALLFAVAGHASAVQFGEVDPEASTLAFRYQQMGVGIDGSFARFEARLDFDPARPEAASAVIEVPLESVDTGFADGDVEVQGKRWFDTASHPLARFESTAVKPLGNGRYELAGNLSIKGHTRPITTEVSVATTDARVTFDGSFALARTDFSVGEGSWAKDDVVAHEITVTFHLVATPLPQ